MSHRPTMTAMQVAGLRRHPTARELREKRRHEREAAWMMVRHALQENVDRTEAIVAMHERGSAGDTYRREIARLWRVAYRAAKEAAR